MRPMWVQVLRVLALALAIAPVLAAIFVPDGYVWGNGKGRHH